MNRLAKRIAGSTLAFGILLSPALYITARLYFGAGTLPEILRDYAVELFAPGYNLFLIALISAAPFGVLALLAWIIGRRLSASPSIRIGQIAAFAGALLATTIATVDTHWAVWADLYGSHDPSSTSVIAFVALPILLLVAVPAIAIASGLVAAAISAIIRSARSSRQEKQ
jgi:hypothetical protein